jgi:very-short-patch-repair endonuclease
MEKYITKQTGMLSEALKQKGIRHICEYSDGHKHVDIGIPYVKIFIEIDGLYHYTDPKQIKADFKRDHYSDGDDFDTIRIPNEIIEEYLEPIAHAIAQIVKERESELVVK